ncbi:hypothetical protein [Microbacterium xanthum]|uniref:hypothetical protein n=1 Tax=Microbacterium xanthum TaxID=3079794 RepID=UPI002AD59624|nr:MULTISPECIES: hypothetical protein [unclassified Microbacterium]MDZ8171564.1 hypothetical protein [Microbacterium sp. KSW-48]MDZ8200397.1 hypothetical protein [Microbacterium sp. SSW1-59]
MSTVVSWILIAAPSIIALGLAFRAWRRAHADLPGGDAVVTTTMFAASGAAGWFVSLSLLSALGPALDPGAVRVAINLDPLGQTFFGVSSGTAYVGGIARIDVLAGLGAAPTVLATLSATVGYLPLAAVAALVAVSAHAMLVEAPTRPAVSRVAYTAAAACLVFGTLQQAFGNLASYLAIEEIDGVGALPTIGDRGFDGVRFHELISNPWPLGAAVALMTAGLLVQRMAARRSAPSQDLGSTRARS